MSNPPSIHPVCATCDLPTGSSDPGGPLSCPGTCGPAAEPEDWQARALRAEEALQKATQRLARLEEETGGKGVLWPGKKAHRWVVKAGIELHGGMSLPTRIRCADCGVSYTFYQLSTEAGQAAANEPCDGY